MRGAHVRVRAAAPPLLGSATQRTAHTQAFRRRRCPAALQAARLSNVASRLLPVVTVHGAVGAPAGEGEPWACAFLLEGVDYGKISARSWDAERA